MTTRRGTLKLAIRCAHASTIASAVCALPPRSSTKATGTSPRRSSGMPTTATWTTPSSVEITRSTSAGETFSPPGLIMSLMRSTTIRFPSPSSRPRSPVCSHPAGSIVAAVASGSS